MATRPGRPRKIPMGGEADAKEQIVGAATKLFASRGVAATTMAEIAEAAGLAASSLYYWFRSKQQILEVIVADVNRAPLESAERIAAEDGPAAVRLYRLVRFDAEALCSLPYDINEVHRLASGDESAFARYWADRARLVAAVEQVVTDGVASGELRPVDARLAALTLLANDEATQNWFRSGPDGATYEPAELADFVATVALRALLGDPGQIDDVRIAAGT